VRPAYGVYAMRAMCRRTTAPSLPSNDTSHQAEEYGVTRVLTRFAAVVIAAAALALPASPANATVHEIVAQWCSGQDHLEPPGLSGGSNADNFVQPLRASGALGDPVPFTGPEGPGLLVPFNYDHPAAKVQGTGVFIVIGETPDGLPIYLELIEPDPNFAAFRSCPRLAG
jgi:hypothetical protein